jgi:hypothetical protein
MGFEVNSGFETIKSYLGNSPVEICAIEDTPLEDPQNSWPCKHQILAFLQQKIRQCDNGTSLVCTIEASQDK